MNEPVRQHLVPRCYLKHFAYAKKKAWYIDAYDITIDEPRIFNVNIDSICVERDFYTFRKLKDEEKRFLERYYSRTVEADYIEVYNTLSQPKEIKINNGLRFKIISFIMCQYFRTSKITGAFNNLWNRTLEHSFQLMDYTKEKKVYFEGGGSIDFTGKSFDEIQYNESHKNREMINVKNYQLFKELTKRRINDVITVNKCDNSCGYIIGDNPVFNRSNIFEQDGWISMPINHNHTVTLIPSNNGVVTDLYKIHKIDMDKGQSIQNTTLNNIFQIENAQKFILGRSQLIQKALDIKRDFNVDEFNLKSQQVIAEIEAATPR